MISIAGNKSDMESLRKVKKGEAEKFAAEHGFKHYTVSAKSGQGIGSVFTDICEEIYRQRFAEQDSKVTIKGRKKGVKINIEEERRRMEEADGKKKDKCCG